MLRAVQRGSGKLLLNRTSSVMAVNKLHTSSLKKQKKAVIFDFGGVIIPTPVPLVGAFAKKYGLSPSQLDELLFKGGDNSLWGQLECGVINTRQFSELLSQRAEQLFGKECHDEIISKMISDDKYHQPFPEMMSAVKQLKSNGIKTALLTNNFRLEDGRTLSIQDHSFDVVFIFFVYFLSSIALFM